MLTNRQLAIRKTRIAASDVSAILGINPWRSPADVLHEKLYDVAPSEQTEATAIGHWLEVPLIEWCALSLGFRADRRGGTRAPVHHPLWCATPDSVLRVPGDNGSSYETCSGIQAKTAGIVRGFAPKDDWGDADSGDVPEWVNVQVLAECFVMDWQYEWVAALIAGRGRVRFRVEFNVELWADIRAGCESWWDRHVVKREPLAQVPSIEVLRRTRRVPGKVIDAPHWLPLVVERWESKKAEIKLANALEGNDKAEILAAFGDAEAIRLPDGTGLTYMERENRGYTVAPYKSRVLQVVKADELPPPMEVENVG